MEEDVELLDEFAAMEAIAKQVDAGKVSIKVLEAPKLVYSNGSVIKFTTTFENIEKLLSKEESEEFKKFNQEETLSIIGKIINRVEDPFKSDSFIYTVQLIIKIKDYFVKGNIAAQEELILGQGGEFNEYYTALEASCKDWEYRESERKKRESLDSTVKQRIDTIEELAELTHPGCWSFQRTNINRKLTDGEQYELLISMPEVKISNSEGRSLIIKDVFIKLAFNARIEHVGRLYGTRLSRSYEEQRSSYIHSHLPAISSFNWQSFCLGGGETRTSELVLGLTADGWNQDNLRSLLILLYGFISWESLQGGPHIKMSNINRREESRLPSLDSNVLNGYYKSFIEKGFDIPLKTYNSNGFINYIIEDKESSYLKDILKISQHKVIRNPNGTTSNYNPMQSTVTDSQIRSASENYSGRIEFRGEILNTFIYKSATDKKDDIDESVLEPSPQVVQFITKELQKNINIYQLKRNLL
jgi:hypothetical protein